MGVYFGTDGIRGVVNSSLNHDIILKCGNALAHLNPRAKIVLGRDTRKSGDYIASLFSAGATMAGLDVIDVGICPTAGISYLTKLLGADFGVVISASHNPPEYNGIKIFDSNGLKLGDKKEEELESFFGKFILAKSCKIGKIEKNENLVKVYEKHLKNLISENLKNLTIVLDLSNGASSKIAPSIFKDLGAKVIATNKSINGEKINVGCGATCPENLSKLVRKYKADLGFSFDGDADRIIAVDEKGNIVDGDLILYVLAKDLKEKGFLKSNIVVGTRHTNLSIEERLKELGMKLIRTDIGDKYVIEKMMELGLSLGGEKSGHIILDDCGVTGDGIAVAIKVAEIVSNKGTSLSNLIDVKLYPQVNINVEVKDKFRVINSEKLANAEKKFIKELGEKSRIMIRVSGTENKVRIMVEDKDIKTAKDVARELEKIVLEINGENK